ncbi:MAG: class I SAM-dependent methyltransferase [Candidatus Krumholzibacteria bacterium]|nr:class I SAM-dependent methyltransferase [Candidatus Krumholzibacteria bacterium]
MKIITKFTTSVREVGFGNTLAKIPNRLVSRSMRLNIDRQFDRKYGVDTSGIIYPSRLDISDTQKKTAKEYEPTPVIAVQHILKSLLIDHSQYTFVDFGSGKGRVLLLASEYPYSNVIGVELSPALHHTAEINIKIWQRLGRIKCRTVQSIRMDATEFKLPQEPLVLFFFTPFEVPIANRVVRNISADFEKNPRPIRIVYYGGRPEFLNVLAQTKFSRKEIYSHRPLAAIRHYRGYVFSSETA